MPRLIQNCNSACGLIGHTDKVCGMKLGRGEVQQYSKKLRCILEKRWLDDGGCDRFGEDDLSLTGNRQVMVVGASPLAQGVASCQANRGVMVPPRERMWGTRR